MQQRPDVTILYGSQTGNAEDMAKRVGLQAKLLGYQIRVETMDDYQLKMLPKQGVVIFICSTTGHGQEAENMRHFYNFIRRRDLPKDCLSDLMFAVYGLGDSSYTKFNYVSKILYKRLKECGAKPLQDLVAGDEQHRFGCDGIFYPKLEELWQKLKQCDSIGQKKSTNGKFVDSTNSYSAFMYSPGQSTTAESNFSANFKSKFDIKEAVCVANTRVTSETHFQDTRFLRFVSLEDIDYEPGDVCTIYPENSQEDIETFIRLLHLDPKQRTKLIKADRNYMVNYLYDFVPDGITIENLVKHYLDIRSIPKRSFFEHLWPFSDDPLERDKLKEFASTEGQEEVYRYCIRPKRTILETMMDFPNTIKNVKFDSLFDMIPPIKPRPFSIASALCNHPNEIHLIVGVVIYKTIMKEPRRGLCSNYLARLEPVDKVEEFNSSSASKLKFFIRRSAFKLPKSNQVPIVMIGPGLGIAPFRGFIEERFSKSSGCCQEKNYFYFGCRHQDKDFYFKDELERYVEKEALRLRVAFSRQEPKRYVQDNLIDDSSIIQKLIKDEEAIVYVAGNSKLPEELRTLLGKMLAQTTGDSERSDEIDRVIDHLEATSRLQYDCW